MMALYYKIFCILGIIFSTNNEVETKDVQKTSEVVVIGGGMAGMAAARRLLQEGTMYVKVFEAKSNRYGGRVWTNWTAVKDIRGADLELGASMLNTRAKKNPLLDLVKEFQIETRNAGSIQVYFPGREKTILSGDNATNLYTEAFKIAIGALNSVKSSGQDIPVNDMLAAALEEAYGSESPPKYDRDMIQSIFDSLPTVNLEDFSALQYEIENDFGWDQIVVDGVGALLDRIVAGPTGRDIAVKVELKKVLRHIKIDHDKKKVLIRTTDRKQTVADAVIIALPIGVLKSGTIMFEPPLEEEKYKAIQRLGVGYSCKVIVGFEEAFWPKDVGTFTVFSDTASNGFLQTWSNSYRITGNPFLTGNILGEKALMWETKSEDEQKADVLEVLSEMFGEETVAAHEITTFLVSDWSSDNFTQGSVSYPVVGSTPELWKTLQEPACPYIFFAGAYTESSGHVDSLHGAYNSGIRAAEQLISHVCRSKSKATRKAKKSGTQKASKKDEL